MKKLVKNIIEALRYLFDSHSIDRYEYSPVVSHSRHCIPESVKARQRAEWERIGTLEPTDEAGR